MSVNPSTKTLAIRNETFSESELESLEFWFEKRNMTIMMPMLMHTLTMTFVFLEST